MTEFEDWLKKKEARRSRIKGVRFKSRNTTRVKRKKLKQPIKKSFSTEVREAAYSRANSQCENPACGKYLPGIGGEHHGLAKSKYRKSDRNGLWNCVIVCFTCHDRVTNPRNSEDLALRVYFEKLAISRR